MTTTLPSELQRQPALRLFRELLPDRVRVLGPLHPDTLAVREWIAKEEGGPESV